MLSVGGLFDGCGLLAFGLHLADLRHTWLCEADPWRRSLLEQRFEGVPVYDDVRTVGAHNAEPVDVIAGGFPCKGISNAGKRQGFGHPETVLWREMRRCVDELRPRYVVVENVAAILGMHDGAVWGEVVGDLAALGYDTTWDVLPAAAVGAPHLRERVFAVAAHADAVGRSGEGRRGRMESDERSVGAHAEAVADTADLGSERGRRARDGRPGPQDGDPPPADAERRGRGAHEHDDDARQPDPARRVPVEWGKYEPAIRRWEAVHGPAPEPLVRRVDERRTAGVERSRLSALGDGVQVQIGELVGRHIRELEERRQMSSAPIGKRDWKDDA